MLFLPKQLMTVSCFERVLHFLAQYHRKNCLRSSLATRWSSARGSKLLTGRDTPDARVLGPVYHLVLCYNRRFHASIGRHFPDLNPLHLLSLFRSILGWASSKWSFFQQAASLQRSIRHQRLSSYQKLRRLAHLIGVDPTFTIGILLHFAHCLQARRTFFLPVLFTLAFNFNYYLLFNT